MSSSRCRAVVVGLASSAALVATVSVPASASPAPTLLGHQVAAPAAAQAPVDLIDRIKQLPGVSSVTEAAAPDGYRFFKLTFTQPVDHRKKHGPTFEQRLTLLHKDTSRPMVMYTGGYYVSQSPSRSEPTRIVDGNQLSMEYRFFNPSRPSDPDWPKQLTIWQAATDQHRIIESFKRLYDQHWLTTGGSKGGMTATYHRRFYPKDVNGTIPYVAPNDVVDDQDVYNEFLDQVGDSQQCRDDLTALQRRVLGADRQWFLDRTRADAAAKDYTWDIVGSLEKGWEAAVVDMYWAFWQYSRQADCATIPKAATATNEQVYQFFERVSPMTTYADQPVSYYTPYYYQASYQLGGPEPYENRIADLLEFPGADVPLTFVPGSLKPIDFDEKAMPDVDRWVRHVGSQLLYVYGSNDPWGAEPFDCGKAKQAVKRECYRYYVPGGNHGSNIAQLPSAEREFATDKVLQWAGLGASDPAVRQIVRHGKAKQVPGLDKKENRRMGVH